MSTQFCPECRQPLGDTVHGVRLPAFKAKLFRYIERHPGQMGTELAQTFDKKPVTIQVHVYQINELMMNTDIRITGSRKMGYQIIRKATND